MTGNTAVFYCWGFRVVKAAPAPKNRAAAAPAHKLCDNAQSGRKDINDTPTQRPQRGLRPNLLPICATLLERMNVMKARN